MRNNHFLTVDYINPCRQTFRGLTNGLCLGHSYQLSGCVIDSDTIGTMALDSIEHLFKASNCFIDKINGDKFAGSS